MDHEVTGEEILKAIAAFEAEMDKEGPGQISILGNLNIDLESIETLWSGIFNDAWAPKINEKLDSGFITIRVQTEWREGFGHQTMIYMVKLKKELSKTKSPSLTLPLKAEVFERLKTGLEIEFRVAPEIDRYLRKDSLVTCSHGEEICEAVINSNEDGVCKLKAVSPV